MESLWYVFLILRMQLAICAKIINTVAPLLISDRGKKKKKKNAGMSKELKIIEDDNLAVKGGHPKCFVGVNLLFTNEINHAELHLL